MWFKNLYCYRFTKPFDISAEALAEHLEAFPFNPCSNQQESSSGWVSPLGAKYPDYVHAAGGYIMVCLKRQDRVLPAAVLTGESDAGMLERVRERGLPLLRKPAAPVQIRAVLSSLISG